MPPLAQQCTWLSQSPPQQLKTHRHEQVERDPTFQVEVRGVHLYWQLRGSHKRRVPITELIFLQSST